MAENIKIQLSDNFEPITEEDISKSKRYILRRESAARGLSSLIDGLLEDAAEKITLIAYRYGVRPEEFQISPKYNEKMFEEIGQVLDELEDEILDLTTSYATKCTEDKEKKPLLILWILALGKNNKGLKQTLEDRLWVFSRDIEAMIAAAKTAKMDATKAVTVIKSFLHTAYQMPGMAEAFKNYTLYKATYIRSRGVKYGNRGSSNSEANNIERFGRITVQMAWMHNQYERIKEQGAVGFWVGRGSSYPCRECDSYTGYHPIDEVKAYPPRHGSCCCWAVPIFERDIQTLMQ